MTTLEPRVFSTWRQFTSQERERYEKLVYLIKKYGCPVSKVSDSFEWIRVYFEIPIDSKDAFLRELHQ